MMFALTPAIEEETQNDSYFYFNIFYVNIFCIFEYGGSHKKKIFEHPWQRQMNIASRYVMLQEK